MLFSQDRWKVNIFDYAKYNLSFSLRYSDIVYFLSFSPPQVVARIYVSTRDVPYKRVQFACIVSGKTVFAADVS